MTRTYGETKDCAGCRFWSEMLAMAVDERGLVAMCLAGRLSGEGGPLAGKYTQPRQTCTAWMSGHLGAVDQPPDYGEATQAQYDVEAAAKHPNGAPMWSADGSMMLDENGNRSIFDDVDK